MKKHSAAGVLLRGGTAEAVAVLVLMADIFTVLDAAGVFDGEFTFGEMAMAKAVPADISWAYTVSSADALAILAVAENSRKQLYGKMFPVKQVSTDGEA